MIPDPAPIPVLVVDDDADCRLLVRDALEQAGVPTSVHEVATGDAGLRFVRRQGEFADAPRPALIFMDLEMPGTGDGIETVRRIRADATLRDVPIVMLSGVSDGDHLRAAAAAGANSYTIKPADGGQFVRTVAAAAHYWLRVHQYPDRHLPAAACRR